MGIYPLSFFPTLAPGRMDLTLTLALILSGPGVRAKPSLSPSAVFSITSIQIYLLASFSVFMIVPLHYSYTADREGEEVNHMTRYKNGQKERNTNRIYQHQISLYVSDAQMDFLESECNKLSMKLSTYIRDLIDKEKAEYESYLKK